MRSGLERAFWDSGVVSATLWLASASASAAVRWVIAGGLRLKALRDPAFFISTLQTKRIRNLGFEHFKSPLAASPVHRLERLLVWIVAVELTILPWALGGTRLWAQIANTALSVVALIVALLPRNYAANQSEGQLGCKLYTVPKLLRFPIFWFGFALLLYITFGALNPFYRFATDGHSWWIFPDDHISWLPSTVWVPFSAGGPWRLLFIYFPAWAASCACWVGFTRRRSIMALLIALSANSFVLAGLGIAERALNADKIFWFWRPPAAYFVSSFIYKNHAGAYFNLLFSICVGLALWYFDRGQRRLAKSNPGGIFAFFAASVAVVVFFSYSRTATVLLLLLILLLTGCFFFGIKIGPKRLSGQGVLLFAMALFLVAFVGIGMKSLKVEKVVDAMASLRNGTSEPSSTGRIAAARGTLELIGQRPLMGWGAGSFEFVFPLVQPHYPTIVNSPDGKRLLWEHAHNDYLEIYSDEGIFGALMVCSMGGWLLLTVVRIHGFDNPLVFAVVCGLSTTLIHSLVDFNFYNAAILFTFCVVFVCIVRMAEIETFRRGF